MYLNPVFTTDKLTLRSQFSSVNLRFLLSIKWGNKVSIKFKWEKKVDIHSTELLHTWCSINISSHCPLLSLTAVPFEKRTYRCYLHLLFSDDYGLLGLLITDLTKVRKEVSIASCSEHLLGFILPGLMCPKIPTCLLFKCSLSLSSMVSLSVGHLPISWLLPQPFFFFNFLFSHL